MITPVSSRLIGRLDFVIKHKYPNSRRLLRQPKHVNCSDKCGWYWVWVWRSLEGSIQTNWNGFLRYFLQSFVHVKILDIVVYGADCTWIFKWMVCFFVCDMHCWTCFTGFRLCLPLPFLSTFGLFLTNLWWQVYINQVIYPIFECFLKYSTNLCNSSLYSATATVCEQILYDLNLRLWPSQPYFLFLWYITVCGEEGFEADATIKLLGNSVSPGLVLILSVE